LLLHGSMANPLISCVMTFLRLIVRRMNGKHGDERLGKTLRIPIRLDGEAPSAELNARLSSSGNASSFLP
jgi:hypothetical protein